MLLRWLCSVSLLLACEADRRCSEWRWGEATFAESEHRIPLGVFGSKSDLWVVGGGIGERAGSLVLHSTGGAFQAIDVPSEATLWWVWASGPGDVWFVGEAGTILHFDGKTTVPATLEDALADVVFSGVWGAGPNDVWAVGGSPRDVHGEQNVIVHWDGSQWERVHSGLEAPATFFKVWGSSATDVFAVGSLGTIVHFDGQSWQPMVSGVTATLTTVHGRGPNEVWAVGIPATVLRYDGRGWSPVGTSLVSSPAGVAVTAESVFIVGFGGLKARFERGVWMDDSAEPPYTDFHAVWADDGGSAFCFGGNFAVLGEGQPRKGVIGARSSSCKMER